MRVLVLGATGFLGGAILDRLVARGDEVRALVRDPKAMAAMDARGVEAYAGQLGDPSAIASAAEGCHFVVNAAGIVSPRAAPRALRWTHVAGSENVVNASLHAGVRRLVHVSCADVVLANEDRLHWDEGRAPTDLPLGDRARSLQLGEEVALAGGSLGLEVIVLRPTWVWGPGDLSRLPSLCREGLDGGVALCGDGKNLIATTHIDLFVDAALAALEAPREATGQSYYVADGSFLDAGEFFSMISEAVGLPPPRRGVPLALGLGFARLRRGGPAGLSTEEMIQRARGTSFAVHAMVGQLGIDPERSMEEGMRALSTWVESMGGAEALARRERPIPDARSVDDQVQAAGGD